jgi:monoterpene epsilon-lactone hydrolase
MKSSLILLMVVIFGTAPMLFIVGCKGKVEPTAGFEGPQVRGLSWQARALKAYMIAKRRFSPQSNELDVARERASVESMTRMFKSLGAVRWTPVAANGVPAEWIVPEGLESDRAILYLHGGSFIAGSIVSHRTLAGNVALAARSRSLLLDYRLAPEHPFPAAIEDAVAGYEWLLAQGFAPAQIVVAGDSAGGNLSLSLLVYLRDHHRPLPAAAVCLSPVPDLTYSSESWVFNLKKDMIANERMERLSVEVYLNGADPRTPLASPYFADLQGLPPLLIQVGSHEVILSDAMRFAEKAKQARVEVTLEVWPGMQHVWQFAATLMPESRRAIFRIGEFIQEEFRKSLKDHDHIIGGVHRLNSKPEYFQPRT